MAIPEKHSHVHAVTLSEKAAEKLKEFRKADGKETWGLRFAVEKGFCGAGFEYRMDFAPVPTEDEEVFMSHGMEIFVPKECMDKLSGCYIDFDPNKFYKDERFDQLLKFGFTIENHNAKGACPCNCQRGFDF